MTKSTTMVTNNVFRSIRPFKEGSNNMVLFSLQHRTLRSNITDHNEMVVSRNKVRSIQILRMRPKQRFWLKSRSFHFMISFEWRYVHQFAFRGRTHNRHKIWLHNMIATNIFFLFSNKFSNKTLDNKLRSIQHLTIIKEYKLHI